MSAPAKQSSKLITFGCRLNSYESEVMKGLADQAGLDDAVIINTCAVTAEAERQARQAVRRARRENPNAKIIVTGCAAQIHPDDFANMPEVDRVVGNDSKMQAKAFHPQLNERLVLDDIMAVTETAGHLVAGFEGKTRTFLQVQNGCDHRCTFCIIPYGRGNSRSVPIGAITSQIKELVAAGIPEIVLTGVDLTSYGSDLPGTPRLGQLVRRLLAQIPDLPRLRLSSVDPGEIDEDLWQLIGEEPRLMPHMHLSVQAGDNLILKRMKRRHSREDVLQTVARLRDLRPDMLIGADLIAGFPTETDAQFQNSLALVHEARIAHMHVFPYSEREGTPAAKMPSVEKQLRKQRAEQIRLAGQQVLAEELTRFIGQSRPVLMEQQGWGHDANYGKIKVVETPPPAGWHGQVIITGTAQTQNGDSYMVAQYDNALK